MTYDNHPCSVLDRGADDGVADDILLRGLGEREVWPMSKDQFVKQGDYVLVLKLTDEVRSMDDVEMIRQRLLRLKEVAAIETRKHNRTDETKRRHD